MARSWRSLLLLVTVSACARSDQSAPPDTVNLLVDAARASDLAAVTPIDAAASQDLSVVDLAAPDLSLPDSAIPTTLALAVPCVDSADDVYVTPMGLPALGPSSQGDVVRCHHDVSFDETGTAVDATLTGKGIALGVPSSGVTVYRIAFRTFRGNQTAAASTARVYLPTTPRALPLPIIVVGHPSQGMGDACAPSKDQTLLLEVALPWAARGYAVITPDYTGLGNEGVQGYLDNRDQGQALLDGARALRKLMLAGTFTQKVVVEGWSQGGGAVLSAQALAKSYGADGELAAVVAFAPEWPIRDNSFAFVDMVNNPDTFVSYDLTNMNLSYSNHVIWTQRAYGYFANFSQLTSDGGAAFPSGVKSTFVNDMDNLCGVVAIGAAIYIAARPPFGAKNGDLFDPAFRTSLSACFGSAASSGCSGLGKDFYTHFEANHLHGDPAGAPVLLVQGLLDTVLPPAKEAACIAQKLTSEGLTPQVCVDPVAQHSDIVSRNIKTAIDWVEARLAGMPAPACPTQTALPSPVCN